MEWSYIHIVCNYYNNNTVSEKHPKYIQQDGGDTVDGGEWLNHSKTAEELK